MQIINTAPYFLENYTPSVDFLEHYYKKFSKSFEEYFKHHCKNANVKIKMAIEKYPAKISEIKESSKKIENLIKQVAQGYRRKYNVTFTEDVHIIIGAFGSNAFNHRQIIPEITFCLEQLSSNDDHLKVIIAHEFGHALHNILTDREGMDWSNVQWYHPFTTLFQEGCATYFSKQVSEASESVYFTYDDSGEDWLRFAIDNKREIISTFLEHLNNHSQSEIFREWFSINGGSYFGFTRLGYFIGYTVVMCLLEKYREVEAVTLWKKSSFYKEIKNILLDECMQ